MVRGALFSALGGLDTAFVPAYYEESDFCLRLWEHGHRVVYDPAVRIRHFEFASEVAPGWAVELQQRHRALFVERHPSFLAAQPNPSSLTTLKARARLAAGCRRVLVIDDRVPLPWLGQGYPRAASWIAAMATQGHAVTHYPLQFPREDWSDVRRALPDTVEVMLNHGTPALADFLLERQGLYDVVIISRPHNMQVLSRLLKQQPTLLGSATLVYDAEALFSLREIARAALDKRPLSAAEQQQRVVKELALTRDANCVVAVSEAEAAHFRDAGYSQVEVIGHAIDKALDTPGFGARQDLLFVGALNADDTPNSDSVRWFVTEVWPAVRKALGDDIRLHVVGTCEAPSVRALAAPDVILHGRAEALAPHLDTARVFVVPTRYAAGIPHKAHEAAARGLPMVVTPLIAGQLGWDSFVTVGVDAVAFASACVNLHQNEAAWQYQREELYAAIDRDCSPHAFRQAVARVLEWTPTSSQSHEVGVSVGGIQTLGVDAGLEAVTDEQRTAALWGRDAAQRADVMRQRRHWSSHPVTAAEINRLISGDASVGWVEHLKHTRFPRERARGMSLGCGSGAVVIDALRLGIVQQMEGIDLSSGAIEIATARSAAAGLGKRARFQVANVNAMEIQGPLDLIVFEQSLHHVDALDTVLGNCAAALALDGWLVVNEYVGPDRFQWSGEAERLMNAILERLPDGYKRHPDDGSVKLSMQRVDPQAVIDLDPSEAIHSSAIIGALEARFECVERRDFGGTLLQFLLADIAANFDPDDYRDVALLRLTTLLETELIRCGVIGSDFVYAVYRHKISDHQLGP
jgi:SAM-dependent methyltransferase